MGRRNLGVGAIAGVLSLIVIWSGCSRNWIGEARAIVSVLIPATVNLVTLVATLQGKTVSAEEVAIVQSAGKEAAADLQLVQGFIAAYEKADETSKAGILNEVQNVIGALQGNLQGLIQGLHIKDEATQRKIAAVVGLLQAEVDSLAAIVPVVQGQGRGTPASRRLAAGSKNPLSAEEFVKSYNSALRAKSGDAELDRVAMGLRIQ